MDENQLNEKFDKIYKSRIEPNIKKFELYRLEQKKKADCAKNIALICFFIALPLIFIMTSNSNTAIIIPSFIPLLIAIIYAVIYFKIINKYRKAVKHTLLTPILSMFGDLKLLDTEAITLKEIHSLGLYQHSRTKLDDDVIAGTYKGVPLKIAETKLSHTENCDKSSNSVTDFSGIIIKTVSGKKFKGTIIGEQITNFDSFIELVKEASRKCPEQFPPENIKFIDNIVLKTVSNMEKTIANMKRPFFSVRNGMEQVKSEDVEFNEKYNIYSDNQIEARYVLTPSFMEKLKKIQSVFLVTGVDFAFKNEYVYLFLNYCLSSKQIYDNKKAKLNFGFFEVGDINETLLNKNIYLLLVKELISIFDLIGYLKLNGEAEQ